LILAAAANAKVRATRSNARRRGRQHLHQCRAGISLALFNNRCFHQFAGKHIGHEDGFSTSFVAGSGDARKAISAVDEFFYSELHSMSITGCDRIGKESLQIEQAQPRQFVPFQQLFVAILAQ